MIKLSSMLYKRLGKIRNTVIFGVQPGSKLNLINKVLDASGDLDNPTPNHRYVNSIIGPIPMLSCTKVFTTRQTGRNTQINTLKLQKV